MATGHKEENTMLSGQLLPYFLQQKGFCRPVPFVHPERKLPTPYLLILTQTQVKLILKSLYNMKNRKERKNK
jgi:hypothetical protein